LLCPSSCRRWGGYEGRPHMLRNVASVLRRAWTVIHSDQRGLTTLEYVIAAGIILVVLAAAILAGVYLPAFVLLVVLPLFLSTLGRL
jgi:hypothetical protein